MACTAISYQLSAFSLQKNEDCVTVFDVRAWLTDNSLLFIDLWSEDEDPEKPVTREEIAAIVALSVERSASSEKKMETVEEKQPTHDAQPSSLDACDDGSPFIDVSPDRWSCGYIKRMRELMK